MRSRTVRKATAKRHFERFNRITLRNLQPQLFNANSTKCTIRLVKILYLVKRSQTPHFIIFLRHTAHCVILLKHSLCLRKANCVNSAKAESLFQRQIRLCTSSCFSTRSVLRYRFEAFLHSRVLPSAKAERSRRARTYCTLADTSNILSRLISDATFIIQAQLTRAKSVQQKLIVSTMTRWICSMLQQQLDAKALRQLRC